MTIFNTLHYMFVCLLKQHSPVFKLKPDVYLLRVSTNKANISFKHEVKFYSIILIIITVMLLENMHISNILGLQDQSFAMNQQDLIIFNHF